MSELLMESRLMNASRKYSGILCIVLVLFPITIFYSRYLAAPCDDAYILLVYAKNFLSGNGWTYNGARVEGFSTTLWLGLITLFGVTRIPLPIVAEILSILSGLLCLLATFQLGKRASLEPTLALLPCCLLAATGDFAFYMSVGLEEILFTALVAWCIAIIFGSDREELLGSYRYPALLAAMILTRPEGALIAALLLLWMAFSTRKLLLVLRCGIVLTIMLAPFLIAKKMFYGYWLPNTYYVKSNAGLANWNLGKSYLYYAWTRYKFIPVVLFFLFLNSIFTKKIKSIEKTVPLLLISAVWITSVAIQGGDNLAARRVLLPIAPLIYVSIIVLLSQYRQAVAIALSVVLCGYLVQRFVSDKPVLNHIATWRSEFVFREKAGIYLRDHFPPNTLVALNAAGIIPYFSGQPTIDMLGLNDSYIAHHGKRDFKLDYAHQAGDGAYVLSRKPDVILFGGSALRLPSKKLIGDQEIWKSDEFHKNYEVQQWPDIGYAWIRKKG